MACVILIHSVLTLFQIYAIHGANKFISSQQKRTGGEGDENVSDNQDVGLVSQCAVYVKWRVISCCISCCIVAQNAGF